MSQARRGFFGRCIDAIKENTCLKVTAVITPTIVLTTGLYVLDIVCNEKMENENIDWAKYRTFGNIFNLFFGILTQTYVFSLLPIIVRKEIQDIHSAIQFAEKAMACMTVTGGIVFANKALTCNIADDKWGYAAGSTAIETAMYNAGAIGVITMLKAMNISILPITKSHVGFISAGIVLAIMQAFLNAMIDQMMKHHFIYWNELTASEKNLAWEGIEAVLLGCGAGLLATFTKKYVELDCRFVNGLVGYSTLCFIFNSSSYAGNSGINKENAVFIATHGAINGAPLGACIAMGLALFTTNKENNARINQATATARMPLLADIEEQPENQRPPTPH